MIPNLVLKIDFLSLFFSFNCQSCLFFYQIFDKIIKILLKFNNFHYSCQLIY